MEKIGLKPHELQSTCLWSVKAICVFFPWASYVPSKKSSLFPLFLYVSINIKEEKKTALEGEG